MCVPAFSSNFVNFLSFGQKTAKKSPPPLYLKNLEELGKALLNSNLNFQQLLEQKEIIKKLLNSPDLLDTQLDQFLTKFMEWAILKNVQQALPFLSQLIDSKTLLKLAQKKATEDGEDLKTINALAKSVAEDYQLIEGYSFKATLSHEWKKIRPIVIYFIPNILNVFLDTFNFLNNKKQFTSLWEAYLFLEIVYKFVLVPYMVIQILHPILVSPAKVYLVAALILVGLGITVTAYQKWFRPVPNEIVNCVNLENLLMHKNVNLKVGQSQALDKVVKALIAGSNVLIIGKSGEGKTALVHHLVQLKKEGRLPKELENLHFFALNCGDLMGHGAFNHAEMIKQTKEKIGGFEKKLLMFFDEFDQFTANPACFQTCKQRFLNEDEARPKFIAATTLKGLEKIKQLDADGSFMQRVVPIILESPDDKQCRLVINEFLNRKAKGLPIALDAVDVALELSKDENYLPQIGRVVKAKKIMRAAIGRCRWAFDERYMSKELNQAKDEYRNFELEKTYQLRNTHQQTQKKQELRTRIQRLEVELGKQKKQIQKIKYCIHKKEIFVNQYAKLAHQLAKSSKKNGDKQNLFLLMHFYYTAAVENVLHQQLDQIKDKREVQINGEMVRAVFQEFSQDQRQLA